MLDVEISLAAVGADLKGQDGERNTSLKETTVPLNKDQQFSSENYLKTNYECFESNLFSQSPFFLLSFVYCLQNIFLSHRDTRKITTTYRLKQPENICAKLRMLTLNVNVFSKSHSKENEDDPKRLRYGKQQRKHLKFYYFSIGPLSSQQTAGIIRNSKGDNFCDRVAVGVLLTQLVLIFFNNIKILFNNRRTSKNYT